MMLLWAIFVPTPFLRTNKPSNTNIDLAKYEDDVKSYIDVYTDFINYGYDHARTAEGFFYEDWTGRESKRASQLLMQDAVIESYAVLALYYDEKD